MQKEVKRQKRNLVKEVKTLLRKTKNNEFCDVNVHWVSRKLGVSYKYLSRVFAKERYYPLNNLIRVERLRRVHRLLLRYPNMSVTKLAETLGFCSRQYLSKILKNYHYETPRYLKNYFKDSRKAPRLYKDIKERWYNREY